MVGRHFKNSMSHAPFEGFSERSNAIGLTGHEVLRSLHDSIRGTQPRTHQPI